MRSSSRVLIAGRLWGSLLGLPRIVVFAKETRDLAQPFCRLARYSRSRSVSIDIRTSAQTSCSVCAIIPERCHDGWRRNCRNWRHEQNAVENAPSRRDVPRLRVKITYVWNIVEPDAVGSLNAPLFEGVAEANELIRGSWGAASAPAVAPRDRDIRYEVTHACMKMDWSSVSLPLHFHFTLHAGLVQKGHVGGLTT
jgi:hypothetical protein